MAGGLTLPRAGGRGLPGGRRPAPAPNWWAVACRVRWRRVACQSGLQRTDRLPTPRMTHPAIEQPAATATPLQPIDARGRGVASLPRTRRIPLMCRRSQTREIDRGEGFDHSPTKRRKCGGSPGGTFSVDRQQHRVFPHFPAIVRMPPSQPPCLASCLDAIMTKPRMRGFSHGRFTWRAACFVGHRRAGCESVRWHPISVCS